MIAQIDSGSLTRILESDFVVSTSILLQYESLEEAQRALDGSKESRFNGRKLTVEYCAPNGPKTAPREPARRPHPFDYPATGRYYHDDYAPLRLREAYPMRFDRDSFPPPRRLYDADDYYPGRLERFRGAPNPRAYRDVPRRWYEPRHEPNMYERRLPFRRDETYERAPRAVEMQDEQPVHRVDPEERYNPGKTQRGHFESPGPERKMARTDCGRGGHSARNIDLNLPGNISPDRLPAYDTSAEGQRLRSASCGGYQREEW
jgi:hypothetical protein